jgi:hypothetical protein
MKTVMLLGLALVVLVSLRQGVEGEVVCSAGGVCVEELGADVHEFGQASRPEDEIKENEVKGVEGEGEAVTANTPSAASTSTFPVRLSPDVTLIDGQQSTPTTLVSFSLF